MNDHATITTGTGVAAEQPSTGGRAIHRASAQPGQRETSIMGDNDMTAAFHGDPTLKARLIDRIDEAAAAGVLLVGPTSWDGIRGTMVGLLGEGDTRSFEAMTGIPACIGGLFDLLLQYQEGEAGATAAAARAWLDALPVGAHAATLPSRIALQLLADPALGEAAGPRADVIALHDRSARGMPVERAAWAKARAAAVQAANAASDPAVHMAEAAAWSPATSRTVLTDTFHGWMAARMAARPTGDWTPELEARAQALLHTIEAENQDAVERGDPIGFPALFAARDPELNRGFRENIDRYRADAAMLAQECSTLLIATLAAASEDPYLWLEEIESDHALAQVREWNAVTGAAIRGDGDFAGLESRARTILDDDRRIAFPTMRRGMIYNYWTDAANLRGIWRRSPEAAYLAGTPEWDILIDVDALCRDENANWVWSGALLCPDDDTRALVMLSDGGRDATEVREYNLTARQFIDDGFQLPAAKSQVAWLDRDTVLVTTDFGQESLTQAGYPREVRRWSRGTAVAEAPFVDAVTVTDMMINLSVMRDAAGMWPIIVRQLSFWKSQVVHVAPDGSLHNAPLPDHAMLATSVNGIGIAQLQEDGDEGPAGALVAYSIIDLIAGRAAPLELVMLPPATGSIEGALGAKSALYVGLLENVVGRIVALDRAGPGDWRVRTVETPGNSSVHLAGTEEESDRLFYVSVGITRPQTLHLHIPGESERIIASAPLWFDPENYVVEQRRATSADGTIVPYFVVRPRDATGPVPTLLYGYGGFRQSMVPGYLGPMTQFLLQQGFAYAIANIRGGGEFGPAWHAAALRENRQRSYDDFHAVAEHLKSSGVASRLGIQGGSNGGLLVGVAYTQKPELYDAVIMAVPLADMRRYHKLLAGASWMDEYGDPDLAEDWEFIRRYSPYHNLRADAAYPPVLFQTSTKDDRVHPGHARKMAARMAALGHAFDYYENIDGGHGGSADNSQAAYVAALLGVWLKRKLAG